MNTARNKKFFSYVIPSILAFALSGVYTIVDGFFIGRSLGDAGLTTITLGYPVSALVGAIGTGLGLSGAIRFTILNAQGESKKRQECFSGTTLLMLIVAGLLTALLLGFTEPLLHLLGARGDTLELCAEYARVIALGAVFQLLATALRPVYPQYGRRDRCHGRHAHGAGLQPRRHFFSSGRPTTTCKWLRSPLPRRSFCCLCRQERCSASAALR